MLQVRFAEVNRRAVQELGSSLFVATAAIAGPIHDAAVFRAGLRCRGRRRTRVLAISSICFFFDREEGIGGVMRALEQKGRSRALPSRT